MPIFEYACNDCRHEFEQLTFQAQPTVLCPQCGAQDVRRRLSAFSFSAASAPSAQAMEGGCGRCGADTPGQCQLD